MRDTVPTAGDSQSRPYMLVPFVPFVLFVANHFLPEPFMPNLSNRPNILFFFPDQLRFDWIGSNPDIAVRTPNWIALKKTA